MVTSQTAMQTGAARAAQTASGLISRNFNGDITNSYATGDVTTVVNWGSLGGLVGYNSGSDIKNSYATGFIIGHSSRIGGLVGYKSGGTIRNSYWDKTTSGQTSSAGGIGETTMQLQGTTDASGIYVNWSSKNWDFGTSEQYPILKYTKGSNRRNPACSEEAATDLPVCGSIISSKLRYGLSELQLTQGSLSPSFSVSIPNYVGTVVNRTGTIQFKPIAIDPNAMISISVDGEESHQNRPSGTTSNEIMLKPSSYH